MKTDPQDLRWAVLCCVLGGCSPGSPSGSVSDSDASTAASGTGGVATSSTSAGQTSTSIGSADDTAGSTASEGESLSEGSETTGPPPVECTPNDNWPCTNPWECMEDVGQYRCGDISSYLDAEGCPRPACDPNQPCPEGMRCHYPWVDCGRCLPTYGCGGVDMLGCDPGQCGAKGDCNMRICVREDLYPPGYCDPE